MGGVALWGIPVRLCSWGDAAPGAMGLARSGERKDRVVRLHVLRCGRLSRQAGSAEQ